MSRWIFDDTRGLAIPGIPARNITEDEVANLLIQGFSEKAVFATGLYRKDEDSAPVVDSIEVIPDLTGTFTPFTAPAAITWPSFVNEPVAAPVVEAPAEEPATETPVVEAPIEEVATETPVAEVPVVETPAEEALETPAQEAVEDENHIG